MNAEVLVLIALVLVCPLSMWWMMRGRRRRSERTRDLPGPEAATKAGATDRAEQERAREQERTEPTPGGTGSGRDRQF